MKKVLDEEIVNEILNIQIAKKTKIPYLTNLKNNIIIYAITSTILELLKMNLALANFTIPFLTFKFFRDNYKTRNNRHLRLNRKKLNSKIEKLNLEGISIDYDDLIGSKIVKDKSNSRLIITRSKKILKQENNQIYLLTKEEKSQLNSNLKEFNFNKALKRKNNRVHLKYIRTLIIYIILTCSSIANTSYNIKKSADNEETILNYYDDENSLSMNELNYLLKDIETEVMKTIDDDKYSLNEVSTKEEIDNYLLLNAINNNPNANNKEKEVMYEFLDFFNSNPYLDTKEVYSNLVNLKFIRNYNPFSNGIINYNNNDFIISASYYDNCIRYYCNASKAIIAHEVTHAIFDTESIPITYVEGFAELIENEYFKEENEQDYGAYNKNIAITKATIDLIGKDKFLEAMSTDKVFIIKEELQKLYMNNNSYVSENEALLHVNNFLKLLESKLDDTKDTTVEANMLMSFFTYIDYESYDIDKLIRLNYYANILYHGPIKTDSNYYYFNEEKIKQLI